MKIQLPAIVGVSGSNGAGKDVLAELLQRHASYTNVSLSDVLREALTQDGIPHTRENLSARSKAIRDEEGDGAMTRRVLATIAAGQKVCITSLRTPGEVQEIQRAGGLVVWVDADPMIRYERIRSGARSRGETDNVTYDEFIAQEQQEMTPTVKGGGLHMAAVRDAADVHLENNFPTLAEYEAYLKNTFEF